MAYYTQQGLLKRQMKVLNLFKEKCHSKFGSRYIYDLIKVGIDKYTKIPIICRIHGIFYQLKSEHLRGTNCPYCANITKNRILKNNKKLNKSADQFILDSEQIHGKLYDYSKVKYVNSKTKIILICSKHGEFSTEPSYHLSMKTGCPMCKSSLGEKEIYNYLKIKNINFKQEFCFQNLKVKNYLRFDFYLKDLNTIIEYDGIQHFEPVEKFGGLTYLNKVKENDEIKNRFCLENNIKLIRISYKKFKNIKNIIDENIKQ